MGTEVRIHPSWHAALKDEFDKPYFQALGDFVKNEYAAGTVYPPGKCVFRAFDAAPLPEVKVVILGQDPYHGPDQANGLCFSVGEGVPFPPSLLNIFKELRNEFGFALPSAGDLHPWAQQGVLLLNATLTVRAHQAGSHQKKGWETFTDAAISAVSQSSQHVVFMLWGSYARRKSMLIDSARHLVLESPHPSPLSAHRGFFGNGHFAKANQWLLSKGSKAIDWQL